MSSTMRYVDFFLWFFLLSPLTHLHLTHPHPMPSPRSRRASEHMSWHSVNKYHLWMNVCDGNLVSNTKWPRVRQYVSLTYLLVGRSYWMLCFRSTLYLLVSWFLACWKLPLGMFVTPLCRICRKVWRYFESYTLKHRFSLCNINDLVWRQGDFYMDNYSYFYGTPWAHFPVHSAASHDVPLERLVYKWNGICKGCEWLCDFAPLSVRTNFNKVSHQKGHWLVTLFDLSPWPWFRYLC